MVISLLLGIGREKPPNKRALSQDAVANLHMYMEMPYDHSFWDKMMDNCGDR